MGDDIGRDEGSRVDDRDGRDDGRFLSLSAISDVGFLVGVHVDDVTVPSDSISVSRLP